MAEPLREFTQFTRWIQNSANCLPTFVTSQLSTFVGWTGEPWWQHCEPRPWIIVIINNQYIVVAVTAVKFAHDDKSRLACCSLDGQISICQIVPPPATVICLLEGHTSGVTGVSLLSKFTKFGTPVGEWLQFLTPFSDRRYLVPVRRYSRSNRESRNFDVFGPPNFGGRETPKFWLNFKNYSHHRTCGKVWWRSAQRPPEIRRQKK